MSRTPTPQPLRRAPGLLALSLLLAVTGCGHRLPQPGSSAYADYVATFYTGLAALEVGDDTRAESNLLRASDLVPDEPAGWIDWGILALRQRRYDAAATRFNHAHTLAPQDDRILYLQGLLEDSRGNTSAAVQDLRSAVQANPHNLRAQYLLATEIEREGAPNSASEEESLLRAIVAESPGNLPALLDLCRVAAKAGDRATLTSTLTKVEADSASWTPDEKATLDQLRAAAAGPVLAPAALRSVFLRNVLLREGGFRASLAQLAPDPSEGPQPVSRFLRLQTPPSEPSTPDTAMSFTEAVIPGLGGLRGAPEPTSSPWSWTGAIALGNGGQPLPAAANTKIFRLSNGTSLSFPGAGKEPTPEGVLAFDYNYDFQTDLLLVGAGGLTLYRQDSPTHWTDQTAAMHLPPGVATHPYTGAWAFDLEADGDLDVLLATAEGAPAVLRNNGDGTFTPIPSPFPSVDGLRQFAWADLNGDGNPDAALLDRAGHLHVFFNDRTGQFHEQSPTSASPVRALAVADTNPDGFLRLHTFGADGGLRELSYTATGWTAREVAHAVGPTGELRLHAADFDNNGAVDLLLAPVAPKAGAPVLWLGDEHGGFTRGPVPAASTAIFDAADLDGHGRLQLLGLSSDDAAVVEANHGTRGYHWQTIRPRARIATGDQRVNPFGIGGEVEIRSGLLVQKLPMTGPLLHFGLGTHTRSDVARIVWPNGSVRAEFNLAADTQVLTEQRLKGSCPFLFAWNGHSMGFVKDSVPWGSAIGLRINALGTADIAATEEWYKIPRGQLVARTDQPPVTSTEGHPERSEGSAVDPATEPPSAPSAIYDLRVTGELWETYFYDSLALLTVDHPAGTEVFVDERYDVPPVKLALTAVETPRPISRATDDQGHDVTAVLRALDQNYLDNFGRGQYQGVTRDHWVELGLGENSKDLPADTPLYLIAKGWLHPSDSSVNVAMSQGTHPRPQWLSLKVEDAEGRWHTARANLGFPAGRNKICLIDLTGLFQPGAPHRVRLRTNLEVYWDQIEWARGLPQTPLTVHRLQPSLADLHYRGFSRVTEANRSSPEIPHYDQVVATSKQWRDLPGFYTRYGDVRPLLAAPDDRYVIMNAGDELTLHFPAPAAPPAGQVRDFVLAGDGWIKDGDYNSAQSATVLPYPHHARRDYNDAAPSRLEDDWMYQHHHDDWLTWQTRWVDAVPFEDALREEARP